MHGRGALSIWFFIGLLLTIYGALISVTGVYELFVPNTNNAVLANLHATLWWGLVLLALGLFYLIRFRPGRNT